MKIRFITASIVALSIMLFVTSRNDAQAQWCFEFTDAITLASALISDDFDAYPLPENNGFAYAAGNGDANTAFWTGIPAPTVYRYEVDYTFRVNNTRNTNAPFGNDYLFKLNFFGTEIFIQPSEFDDNVRYTRSQQSNISASTANLLGVEFYRDQDNLTEYFAIERLRIEGSGTKPWNIGNAPTASEAECDDFSPTPSPTPSPSPTVNVEPSTTPTGTPTETLTPEPTTTPEPNACDLVFDFANSDYGINFSTASDNGSPIGQWQNGVGLITTDILKSGVNVRQLFATLDFDQPYTITQARYEFSFDRKNSQTESLVAFSISLDGSYYFLKRYNEISSGLVFYDETITGAGTVNNFEISLRPSNGGSYEGAATFTRLTLSVTDCGQPTPTPTANATEIEETATATAATATAAQQTLDAQLQLTATSQGTYTPQATYTPQPTYTPPSTATLTRTPAGTPYPTNTVLPTFTPFGTVATSTPFGTPVGTPFEITPFSTPQGGSDGTGDDGGAGEGLAGIGEGLYEYADDAINGIGGAISGAGEIGLAIYTVPPIRPPGAHDCSMDQTDLYTIASNICAVWYILDNTLFAGIGSLYVPLLILAIDVVVISRIYQVAIRFFSWIKEVFSS
jgi:cell division septation protein DedD